MADGYPIDYKRSFITKSTAMMERTFRHTSEAVKLSQLLLIILLSVTTATAKAQQVSISGKNISIGNILKEIRKQTGYNFICKDEWARSIGLISIDAQNATVEMVMDQCLNGRSFGYSIANKIITIFPFTALLTVTGKVTDKDLHPMQGVSVTIKGTERGTATGQNGEFMIPDVDPRASLVFSFVGYITVTEKVNAKAFMVIRLEAESKMLENATVSNGYQKIQQKYLTGSVTSLKMDSVMQPGLSTVDKMLEGRVPGLTFMLNSGQAGAVPKLRVRGTSTILGSREPLWVVDGIVRTDPFPIPPERLNDPDFVNLLGNSASGINPHDIEQIDVLKDATAAALYGVRAANGVIVITTKRGKPGPPTINYNVTGTFTRRPRYSDKNVYMMNSLERVDVSREMVEKRMSLRGGSLEAYEKSIVDYYDGMIDYNTFKEQVARAETMNTDWLGVLTQDVFSSNHTLSITGGSPSGSYRASIGYANEPGVIRGEYNNRYTGVLNLRVSQRKFKADFNVYLTKGDRNYSSPDILNYAFGTSRAIPLQNEDGSLYYFSTIGSGTYNSFADLKAFNLKNEMDRTGERTETMEYTATANLTYELMEGLQINTVLSYTAGDAENRSWYQGQTEQAAQIRSQSWDNYSGKFDPSLDPLPFGGELSQQSNRKRNYTINGRLDFNRYLDTRKKHLLSGALGAELSSARNSGIAQVRRGYYPERGQGFAVIDPATYPAYARWLKDFGNATITEGLTNLARLLFNTTYVYNDRYVVTAIASSDYSNAFGTRSNEKFLPTWALSGRWNVHEDLLKGTKWVDLFSLLLNYGTQGNMLPNQTPYTIIRKGNINSYFGVPQSYLEAFPNPNLAWERVHDYGAGLEFSFLHGKISGKLGYFFKRTTNAFLTKKVSAINGATSYVVNGGEIENQGVELDLHFRPINNPSLSNGKRGFMWRIEPNLGQTFNKLLNQALKTKNVLVDPNTITYQNFLSGDVPIDGKSINTFYSYRFKGLDHNYGFPVFYGAEPENAIRLVQQYNAMPKEQMFMAVMTESGRREPVLQGSVTNAFAYRDWTLNFTFSYSLGNKIRLMQIASGNYGTFRPSSQQNLRKEFVDRWRYPGDESRTNIPGIQGNDYLTEDRIAWWYGVNPIMTTYFAADYYQMYDFSDLRVVNGDYVKLQYIALGYNFSKNFCAKWKIKGATANLSGNNIFTIADKALRGQDPSQSGSAPNINMSVRPSWSVNFNLTF